MNATVTAIRNIDAAEKRQQDAANAIENEMLRENARAVRKAQPSEQNKAFAAQFARGITDREEQIEKVKDHHTVVSAKIEDTFGKLIDTESQRLSALMADVERARKRLERLESEKIEKLNNARLEAATQIAAAEKAIRAFKAGAAELAEEAE